MYKNTTRFFDRICAYQRSRAEIEGEYAHTVESAQRFKGSAYYDDAMKEAKARRDSDLQNERRSTIAAVNKILDDMKATARNRPFKAPTAEAVNTLQMLKLMDSPTREHYEAVEAFLKDEPFSLAVLDDLAAAHNIHLAGAREPSTQSVLETVRTMERAFNAAMTDSSSSLFSYCPPDEAHCISRFAAIPYAGSTSSEAHPDTAKIEAISSVLNGPEAEA